MSRSWKKNPAGGAAVCCSEKVWKQKSNRRLRRGNRTRLLAGKEPLEKREVSDPWSGPKDGHVWHGEEVAKRIPGIVRK